MDDRSRAIDEQLDRIEGKIRRLATIAEMQIDSHDDLRAETERRFQAAESQIERTGRQIEINESHLTEYRARLEEYRANHQRLLEAAQRQLEAAQRQLDFLSTVVNGHTTNPKAHQ